MRIIIKIMLLFLLVNSSITHYTETIETFTQEFLKLTAASGDVIDKLKFFGKKSYVFLKLAGPVASIISEGLSGFISPESEELIAIKKLHDVVKDQFSVMSFKIESIIQRMEYSNMMADYNKIITVGIKVLNLHYTWASDSIFQTSNSSIADELQHQCRSTNSGTMGLSYPNSPIQMLTWLQTVINENCITPTQLHAQIYVEAIKLTNIIEASILKEFKNLTSSVYNEWKFLTINRLTQQPTWRAHKHIKLLRNHIQNGSIIFSPKNINSTNHLINKLNSAFANVIGDVYKNNFFNCLLKTFMDGVGKKRQPLFDLAEIIMSDLSKIALLGVVCTAVDKSQANMKIKHISDAIETITRKMHHWIVKELASAWPSIIKMNIENEILDVDIEENNYDEWAKRFQIIADERGEQRFLHQIAIVPSWKNNTYYISFCENVCFEIISKSICIIVTQFNLEEKNELRGGTFFDRIDQANQWFISNRDTLTNAMQMSANKNEDLNTIMSVMAKSVKRTYLVGPWLYRTVLLIHNSKFFKKSCVIPVGLATSKIENTTGFNSIEYLKYAFFSDVKNYKLIFFI